MLPQAHAARVAGKLAVLVTHDPSNLHLNFAFLDAHRVSLEAGLIIRDLPHKWKRRKACKKYDSFGMECSRYVQN